LQLYVNLLPVTTSSFSFFVPKDLKKKRIVIVTSLLLYVQVPRMLLTSEPCRRM
jgi:hypothetical protein